MRSFITLTRLIAVLLALTVAAVPAMDTLESRTCLEVDGEEAVDEVLDQKAASLAATGRALRRSRALGRPVSIRTVATRPPYLPMTYPRSAIEPIALFSPLRC